MLLSRERTTVTNPANPVVDSIYVNGHPAVRVVRNGNILYAALSDDGFRILEVGGGGVLTPRGTYDTPGRCVDLALNGNVLFAADTAGGVQILNVADPDNPQSIASYVSAGPVQGVTYDNGLLLASCGQYGLDVVDVANPAAPARVTLYTDLEDCRSCAVNGRYVVVADGGGGRGARILDFQALPVITEAGSFRTIEQANSVAVLNNQIYIAAGLAGLIRIGSDLFGPSLVGDLNLDGGVDATDALILVQYLAGSLSAGQAPFVALQSAANVCDDAQIDARDQAVMLNYLVGAITALPFPGN